MPYALCPMPYALCPMPYARRVSHVTEKGYISIAPVLSLRSIIQQALIKFSVYTNTAQSVKFVNTL
jgi:hypothetical protein